MPKKFSNYNVLVTGGTGFVGSHLVEELVNAGNNVVTTSQRLDPRSYFVKQGLSRKVTLAELDVCNFDAVYDLTTKCNIEYIFHLAAQPLVEVAYSNPRRTLATNFLGTVNVLESARLYREVRGVIFASSDKAYGKHRKKIYLEDDSLRGDHPYEVSKSAADLLCLAYHRTYNIPVVVTRFGNIYGEGDLHFRRIIPGVMKALIKKRTLRVRSDGTYIRDYIYVKDVIDGYLLIASNLDKIKGRAFNFGSADTMAVVELLQTLERALGVKIRHSIKNTAKNEIHNQSLDYSKISRRLGWKPKRSIRETMEGVKRWYEGYFKE